jgi:flagellar biosynthesis/type III secretory pathway protein FliH
LSSILKAEGARAQLEQAAVFRLEPPVFDVEPEEELPEEPIEEEVPEEEVDLGPPPPSPEEVAQAILDEARRQAEALLAQARSEAESVRRQAHQDGIELGRQEGAQESSRLHQELLGIQEDQRAQLDRFSLEIEPALVGLALEIASAIVHYEVESGHPVALETAKACLQRVRDAGLVQMQVNPEDLGSVMAAREELKSLAAGVSELQILADRRVERGGCLVETQKGYWDARVRPQTGRVRAALTEEEHAYHPGSE